MHKVINLVAGKATLLTPNIKAKTAGTPEILFRALSQGLDLTG